MVEFHDDDIFRDDDWINYHCPNCGGYREDGCPTCELYVNVYNEIVVEVNAPGYNVLINNVQLMHEETLRRMELSTTK